MIVELDPVTGQAAPRLVPVRAGDLDVGDVVDLAGHRLIVEVAATLASGDRRVVLSDRSKHTCAPSEMWAVVRGPS